MQGVIINKEKAWKYYKEAEEKVDIDEKARLLKLRADKGYVDAMNQYGMLLDSGTGVMMDKVLARVYFKKAADGGDVNGMYNYGRILEECSNNILDNFDDYVEACHYFQLAAHKDDKTAEEELEKAEFQMVENIKKLEFGEKGIKSNKSKARRNYKIIADFGYANSMNNYARMSYYGDGGPVDKDEALEYYRKSANLGNKMGMFKYGLMLKNGEGTIVDLEKASKYIKAAADLGISDAMNEYGNMSWRKELESKRIWKRLEIISNHQQTKDALKQY